MQTSPKGRVTPCQPNARPCSAPLLPHLKPGVTRLFDYPQQFAEDVFHRIEQELRRCASGEAVARTGRLFIVPDGILADSKAWLVEGDETQILSDRREGKFVVSYQASSGWVAITKSILTEVLGAGRDARITGLPPIAVETIRLMCPTLAVPEGATE